MMLWQMLHVDCMGDTIRVVQDKLDGKNFCALNPAFDKKK